MEYLPNVARVRRENKHQLQREVNVRSWVSFSADTVEVAPDVSRRWRQVIPFPRVRGKPR